MKSQNINESIYLLNYVYETGHIQTLYRQTKTDLNCKYLREHYYSWVGGMKTLYFDERNET